MDNENDIKNLSSLQGDFVVLNCNGNDVVELSSQYSDVQVSDKHTTMMDEKNLIQSFELLMEENTNLKVKIQAINQLLIQRVNEMKDMKTAQLKWREMNEVNHQRAKEEILRLRDENKAYKQRMDKILEELGQIIQREMDPECKKQLENISLHLMDGVQQETKEEEPEKNEEEQTEKNEGEPTETNDIEPTEMKEKGEQTETDGQITKLNMVIAEMTEQLKCKDEQIDLIAKELAEMKIKKPKMVVVSNELTEAAKETSMATPENCQQELASIRDECDKVKSINTQLNENLTSLQKLHTKNQSEIEALKADAAKYQQIKEAKSREFDRLRRNIARLETDKEELQKSVASYQQQQVKSPPASASQPLVTSTEVMVGSAPASTDKSYKRQQSDEAETVQNLMMLFRTERQKCTSLQEKLTKESKRVHDLEMDLLVTQQELESKDSKLDKELSKREKEHKITVQELNKKLDELSHELEDAQEPRYQSTGENMRALRSQVMALMAELEEMNKQVEDANVQVQKRNERIKNLELKNNVIASEQYNQSIQDTAIIERLQQEIKRLSDETKGYEEVVEERNDLLMKFQQLQGLYQDVCRKYEEIKHKAIDEKELNDLTLKLISSQEASGRKDYEIEQLEQQLKHVQDQCSVLNAQADLFRQDFEAERKAREEAHNEKENLSEKMKEMEQEIAKAALAKFQQRYVDEKPPAQTTNFPPHTMPQDPGQYGRQEDYYPHPVAGGFYMGTAQPEPQEFRCPVCQRVFPEIDTLQIHVMDCIQ